MYKRCGFVNPEDGRKFGRRCPLLGSGDTDAGISMLSYRRPGWQLAAAATRRAPVPSGGWCRARGTPQLPATHVKVGDKP